MAIAAANFTATNAKEGIWEKMEHLLQTPADVTAFYQRPASVGRNCDHTEQKHRADADVEFKNKKRLELKTTPEAEMKMIQKIENDPLDPRRTTRLNYCAPGSDRFGRQSARARARRQHKGSRLGCRGHGSPRGTRPDPGPLACAP